MEEDVLLRFEPPSKIYQSRWDEVIDEIRVLVQDHPIIAFHCTRLTQYEIDEIHTNGLQPLAPYNRNGF